MKRKKKLSMKERWSLYPYRLAHHPLCNNFEDHLYTIGKYKVCRGCMNFYSGMLIGIILAPIAIFVLEINFWVAFATTNILYIFTPLSVVLNPPRIIKDFARLLLGIAMISSFLSIVLAIVRLFDGLNFGAIAVIIITPTIYFTSRFYFRGLRDRRNENVCRNCEQFYLPQCDGMTKRSTVPKQKEATGEQ